MSARKRARLFCAAGVGFLVTGAWLEGSLSIALYGGCLLGLGWVGGSTAVAPPRPRERERERERERGLTRREWRAMAAGAGLVIVVLSIIGAVVEPERPEPYCDGTTRVYRVDGDLELQAWAPECVTTTTAPGR